MKTLYEELGVPRDAALEAIKAAYKARVKQTHPDRHGEAKAEEFRRVQQAYEILSDPSKREYYDKTGKFQPEKDNKLVIWFSHNIEQCLAQNFERLALGESLIDMLKVRLKDDLKKFKARKKTAQDQVEKLARIAKRIATVDGEDDFISEILKSQIHETQDAAEEVVRILDMLADVQIRIERYKPDGAIRIDASTPFSASSDCGSSRSDSFFGLSLMMPPRDCIARTIS